MKYLTLTILTVQFSFWVSAQVQIGSSTLEPTARFQVDAATGNAKGFLPPRVALAATSSISPFTATPAEGLLVYNTATAGTSPNNVTPGFYFYDGSKWQRIINQQPDATVEFSVNANPNTVGTSFSGTANSKDFIYVSTIDNSQWVYNGTNYVTYSAPASTPWYISGGTSDAGSNKTGTVYRTGAVGIGSTTTPDASAQLDVNSSSKGFLPPRVALTATNAAGPITSPATGLLVYNTATAGTSPNNVTPGYYFNGGTPAAPAWSAIQVVTASRGVETGKVIYNKTSQYSGDANLPLSIGQISYRLNGSANELKLSSDPGTGQSVVVYVNQVENWGGNGYASSTYSITFTGGSGGTWNTYSNVGGFANGEINILSLTCSNEDKAYRITAWSQGSGSRFNYVILGERF